MVRLSFSLSSLFSIKRTNKLIILKDLFCLFRNMKELTLSEISIYTKSRHSLKNLAVGFGANPAKATNIMCIIVFDVFFFFLSFYLFSCQISADCQPFKSYSITYSIIFLVALLWLYIVKPVRIFEKDSVKFRNNVYKISFDTSFVLTRRLEKKAGCNYIPITLESKCEYM